MKVKGYEVFKCDAGWRTFSFLKLVTDDGIIGWSEYNESFGSPGLSAVIEALMPNVIGMDPHEIELVNAVLATRSTQSRGGIARQAIAAIENALLGHQGQGAGRSGLSTVRRQAARPHSGLLVALRLLPAAQSRDLRRAGGADLRRHDEARRRSEGEGLHGAQDQHRARGRRQADRLPAGFVVGKGFPERNWDAFIARSAAKTVEAFRAGCGPDVGIMLDTNFHFRTEGFRRIAEAVGPARLTWLELDAHDPRSIALIRRDAPCPIASGETLLERRDFRPYFEAYAFDTAIVDVIWNGFNESLKIAAMADVYEVNVAPHNFYGHLASAISAHFCAAVPNFRIMEIDIDGVPWRDDIVNTPPVFDKGDYILPTGPGWGVEVNEAGLRKHPVK